MKNNTNIEILDNMFCNELQVEINKIIEKNGSISQEEKVEIMKDLKEKYKLPRIPTCPTLE